ncbi:hypothetical protein FHT76_008001 [Rhizobium sp. BK176]|nr:hypothetical protein [Rhizobium sp. BK181]MBB3543019.1 hypothetical protein [Rhizobium sp. BK399]MCS4096280.1 hypothetical protein [Rhizobium sp. BK176]
MKNHFGPKRTANTDAGARSARRTTGIALACLAILATQAFAAGREAVQSLRKLPRRRQRHRSWTDPAPTTEPRNYSIVVPATCGKRYLIRVAPKGFCFDESGMSFADQDYLVSYDNSCIK